MSKYKSKKVTVDGYQFDSQLEAQYFLYLKDLPGVAEWIFQPRYLLLDAFEKNGKKYRKMEYIADFEVHYRDGRIVVVDVKGLETEAFKIKKKLFEHRYPDRELQLVKYVKKFGGWVTHDEWRKLKKNEEKRRSTP